ncbi:MAG: DNA polymerase III subunit epsilon [Paracidovorax wautersii]|uniref:DNA polymerase III subunit epsilon n=1 Tax=Paracidovorax wautersii TaxID=1177982 RepID=A0A7V8FKZ2_9BURK|nr:MAG: DNA polymerase III subunit epsilon [Paracidovorax wautersii]
MRQIVLDTETTGLSAANGDRILEVGCVEIVDRRLTGNNKHFYINPERDSHEEALRVHGITSEFLADKPKFAEIADELFEYLAGTELIIHNAPFDVGFLDKELELMGRGPLRGIVANVIDSLALAKEIFPGKRNSLDALCDRLEVNNANRILHGALLDAELLADVYINMTRGQNSLGIEVEDKTDQASTLVVDDIDLSRLVLPVIQAGEQELAAHEAVLASLDKSSDGKTIWRRFDSAPETVS